MATRENAYDRFRRAADIKTQCLKNHDSYFIGNHTSTCTITNLRTEEEIEATLVLTDADGADNAYLFLDINSDFQVSDYFTWKTNTYFAYEQVQIVKDVDYIKFKVLQCNVKVNSEFWAYFSGPLKSVKDTSMSADFEVTKNVPVLIAPQRDELVIGGQINFNNQIWDIEDADIYTVSNIGYYALTRGVNSRTEDEVTETAEDEEQQSNVIYVGEQLTISTEQGYYLSSGIKVKLIKRSAESITIKCLESGKLTIKTLKSGDLVETQYVVEETV